MTVIHIKACNVNTATTVAVLTLHGVAAYASVNLRPPAIKVPKVPEETLSIKIELLSGIEGKPPEQVDLEPIVEIEPESIPEPKPRSTPPPETRPKPILSETVSPSLPTPTTLEAVLPPASVPESVAGIHSRHIRLESAHFI